jgi:hypothetical protein
MPAGMASKARVAGSTCYILLGRFEHQSCAALTDRPNLALSKFKSERMRTVLLVVVSDTLQLVQAQRTHAPRVHARGTEGALLG